MTARNSPWMPRPLALAFVAVSMFASACVVVPERYVGETVAIAPPSVRVETEGVAPGAGYVWIGGYWGWAGGRHEWMPGFWERPHPGYYWVPHTWVHVGGGWRLREGYWHRH